LGLPHGGRTVPDYRCVLTLASWDRFAAEAEVRSDHRQLRDVGVFCRIPHRNEMARCANTHSQCVRAKAGFPADRRAAPFLTGTPMRLDSEVEIAVMEGETGTIMNRCSLIESNGGRGMKIMTVAFALSTALVVCSLGAFSTAAHARKTKVVHEPRERLLVELRPNQPYWDSYIVPRYRYRPQDDRIDPYGPPVVPVIRYGAQEETVRTWNWTPGYTRGP
jgi:hypothetical protein